MAKTEEGLHKGLDWDNLSDEQLRAVPVEALRARVGLYGLVAVNQGFQTRSNVPPAVSVALDRAIRILKERDV